MNPSLPFRFDLTEAMAVRWTEVPAHVKQSWLEEWALAIDTEDFAKLQTLPRSVKATVPDKLDFVRHTCLVNGIAFADAVSSFSAYVTKRLRAGSPVRGELELTAEWAAANLLPGYRLEVVCDVGRVDAVCYSSKLLVEAKLEGAWKGALGQALAYRECFAIKQSEGWSSMLLLLGDKTACNARLVTTICERLGVKVVWYSGKFTKLSSNKHMAGTDNDNVSGQAPRPSADEGDVRAGLGQADAAAG